MLPGYPRAAMRFLRLLGKFLISAGIGVLLFVAWTLWGTGFYTAQQQDALRTTYERLPPLRAVAQEGGASGGSQSGGSAATLQGPPRGYKPDAGDPVFRMIIPRIGLDMMVVEGVSEEDLKLGPGHYPSCRQGFWSPFCTSFNEVWPGQDGRVIVSGHRTTYLHPFYNLNEVQRGDKIILDTRWGRFTYVVTRQEIVDPSSHAIVVQTGSPELVLTTCNPRYSAAQRLIVFSRLKESS